MIERSHDVCSNVYLIAKQAIENYARGILTVEVLSEQILQEWKWQRKKDQPPSQLVLTRLAQGICSRALCEAWRSPRPDMRNHAFDNLRCYLKYSLQKSGYGMRLQPYEHACEDVLHQTLEELHLLLKRNPLAGPDEPVTFLRWVQTILLRQAHMAVEKYKRDDWDSLDARQDMLAEQCIDTRNPEPQDYVLKQESQQAVKDVILSLRNQHYQQVLLYTYLGGLTESEIAPLLKVDLQKIYLWKHRGLEALRNSPELIQKLRFLREYRV